MKIFNYEQISHKNIQRWIFSKQWYNTGYVWALDKVIFYTGNVVATIINRIVIMNVRWTFISLLAIISVAKSQLVILPDMLVSYSSYKLLHQCNWFKAHSSPDMLPRSR